MKYLINDLISYLNTTQTIMVALDRNGRVSMINKSGCELLGYTEDELLGKIWFDKCLTQSEGVDKVYPVFEQIMSGAVENVEYFENRVLCKDGRTPLISWHNAALMDEQGNITGTLSSGQDITEQRENELKRAHTEEQLERQLKTVQLNNRIANILLTSSKEVLYSDVVNLILAELESEFGLVAYVNIHGELVSPAMTREVWSLCQMHDKTHVFPPEKWGGLWGDALKQKKTMISNDSLQPPEGHVQIYNAICVPVVHRSELIGLITLANRKTGYGSDEQELLEGIGVQIAPVLKAFQREEQYSLQTEQLTAEVTKTTKDLQNSKKKLSESDAKFRGLVESSSDWIWEVDRNGLFTYSSPQVKKILGYAPQEVEGKTLFDLVTAEEKQSASNFFMQAAEKSLPLVRFETTKRHKNGKNVILESNGSPFFNEDGELAGYRGIDRDITKHKDTEAELKRHHNELEHLIEQGTRELHSKIKELKLLNSFMMDRELRVIELKNEVNELQKQLNRKKKYL